MRTYLWVCLFLFAGSLRAGENWPQFRGGARAGVGEAETLPTTWGEKTNLLWKADLPGRGWSSPIVWEDRVYVTSVVSSGQEPEPRKGLYIQDLRGKQSKSRHQYLVLCLDRKTGKVLWKKVAHQGAPQERIHIKNSYASETPATDGERVYAYFGNLGLFCFDKDGKKLWEKRVDPVETRFGWGTAASPALHKGRIYLVNDNEGQSYLLALDAKTGKEVWRVDRKEGSNWATPFVWENAERTEIVTAGTGKVRSYDTDGKLLWELRGMSSISIPSPFAADGLLYVTSGYILDPRKPLYAIRPGAEGDITLEDGKTSNRHIAWCQRFAGPYHPTPIAYDGHIYVLLDRGTLSCYDAKTGKKVYERKPIKDGRGAFTASPWAYDGKIFCMDEDGVTYVMRAGPKPELLGTNTLSGMALATPALGQGCLLIRTMDGLYCLKDAK